MADICQSEAMLYMDYNATTPLAAEVVADITDSLAGHWANPSSTHGPGRAARRQLEAARAEVAEAVGARPEHVIFTSGGTEANNMVILGAAAFYRATGRRGTPHLITSDTEHDAVEGPVAELERSGRCSVTRLKCRSGGRVEASDLRDVLTPDTCLVSVMHANNETGVINDIEALGSVLSESPYRQQVWFHTDSAQTVGKVEVDVARLGVDFLTVVGHKLYGPRIAALYASPLGLTRLPASEGGAACLSLLRGGGQEGGLRPGTENTPLVRGLGTACRLVAERGREDRERMRRLRDLLEKTLLERGVAERVNLAGSPRLPNTSSLVLASGGSSGRQVLRRCRRLLASVGSACHEAVEDGPGVAPVTDGPGYGRRGAVSPGGHRNPGDAQNVRTVAADGQDSPQSQLVTGDRQDPQPACEEYQLPPGPVGGLSAVLLRSGVSPEDARRTVRLSLGRQTTEREVVDAVEDLAQALLQLRAEAKAQEA